MCRVLRHLLVLTLSVSLVAGAAAWGLCPALQTATAVAAATDHGSHATGHHADAAGHGEHDHHAMQHKFVQDDPATPAADDHGCKKCCAMCTVATALPPAAGVDVIFIVSSAMLARRHETKSGHVVAVDPGIPKRIV